VKALIAAIALLSLMGCTVGQEVPVMSFSDREIAIASLVASAIITLIVGAVMRGASSSGSRK